SNVRGTSGNVVFQGPGIGTPRLIAASGVNWVPPNTAKAVVDLTGLDTGVYSLAIRNPGAADSNAVSFTVTPGQPTVSSVCVAPSAPPSCVASAQQVSTPVNVTVSGTNFAKPDANGNAASQVMVSPDGTNFVPLTGSAITIASSTVIQVAFDTRTAAIPACSSPPCSVTYHVAVWNPGGPTPPQKSNSNVTFTVTQ
ncbi:MAG TPA: hypothetical protein VFK90_15525, partial [Anaeromyxobacter sp.]|nr:hypothetical protein [Anaeromyxobacter sp.]